MASPPDPSSRSFPLLPWLSDRLAPFITHILVPLLIIASTMAALATLPPLFGPQSGHAATTRFLAGTSLTDPHLALTRLAESPTRLGEHLPAGPSWLLANLPALSPTAPAQALLLTTHALKSGACWPLADDDQPAAAFPVQAPLPLRVGVLGSQTPLPAASTATRALCRIDLTLPQQLTAERWSHADLLEATGRQARAIGLAQGGLWMLVLFLWIIALTMRESPYVLLGCWLIGNMRLGAWALGWDYQWLGFLIPPEDLLWVRKITLVLYCLITFHLFAGLFRDNLEAGTRTIMRRVGSASLLVLLVATFVSPYDWFQSVLFLAAWLGTGLIAVLLIHALYRSHTRGRLWHTVGVCIALGIMLLGLTLIGIQRSDLIEPQLGTLALLLCNLLIALAVADQMRERRMLKLRERNELIAHDSLTPLGMFTLGATRHFEHLNPNARAMLNLASTGDLPARAWTDFFPDIDWLKISLATEQGQDTEVRLKPGQAEAAPRAFLLRATMAGSRIEGSLQDMGARSETIRKLRLAADNDPLTDTLSRHGIETAMQASIDEMLRADTPAAMAFLDLDHLKRINDLFGHSAGDTLLQTVCERIKYSLTERQSLGRVGNDEFVILFPNMRAGDARRIGQDIVESLNGAPLYVGERVFQLKTAMGLIDIDRKMRPKDAIAAASRACRDARRQHQDLVLYEENAHELFDHIDEQHLFEQLEQDAPPQDFYLEMQPIMSLRHPLRTLNFEALLRVKSSGDRPVRTDRIIQAAEDSGMITAIDKWVFTSVLSWMAEHHTQLNAMRQINVNLSGVSLNDDRFVETLFSVLSLQPQFSRSLCVEITEGVALQDLERTRQFMRRLQRMGARVALDDFGAGYTSFSYLKELPADMIKIDGSLIRDMLESDSSIAIVNSIVDLAHNLGMECIAEWVEDLPTLRALTEMGVDHVQGYIVSTPRPPEDMLTHGNILSFLGDPAVRSYVEEISGRRAS